jgi:diadenosine tetraphosphate (Ap4A) HIT family hydrolase
MKFNYPNTLLHEYKHWVVLLRPKQVTLGSVILAHKGEATKLPEVSPESFSELAEITKDIESTLNNLFQFEKINYLLLMMVDKNVHFHVIPRYSTAKQFMDVEFVDTGWPKPIDITKNVDLKENQFSDLLEKIKTNWQSR